MADKTDIYLSGEASTMKDTMGAANFMGRASMADLCLRSGEKTASCPTKSLNGAQFSHYAKFPL
jgi:hypothetical protein